MLMALKMFWSVRHVYFAFCCHDMILSKNVLIDDRDYEREFLTSEACVCLLVIV